MLRLFLRLLNIRDFESCKSCETLRIQLEIANEEKKEMTQTLLGLIQPKVYEATPINVPAFAKQASTFSQRRPMLEKQHEARKDVRDRSPFIVPSRANTVKDISPETVADMEKKLNLAEEDDQAKAE